MGDVVDFQAALRRISDERRALSRKLYEARRRWNGSKYYQHRRPQRQEPTNDQ